ncbi:MAG: hypothetical protein V1831_04000 [Candidatus Woesearchaeota archaeon]
MSKKIIVTLLITLALFLFIGCAKQTEQPAEQPSEQLAPVITESPDDGIATGISDISSADEELDASELDDLGTILRDIENI